MNTYRCPDCGSESDLTPRYGTELVSVYCLQHRSGVRDQMTPVLMELLTQPTPLARPERVAVG